MGIEEAGKQELTKIVAKLWQKRGFQTKISNQRSETFVLAKQNDQTQKKELVWINTVIISGKDIRDFSNTAKKKGFNTAYCISIGGFESKAIKIAKQKGVKCINKNHLETILQKNGFANLIPKEKTTNNVFRY